MLIGGSVCFYLKWFICCERKMIVSNDKYLEMWTTLTIGLHSEDLGAFFYLLQPNYWHLWAAIGSFAIKLGSQLALWVTCYQQQTNKEGKQFACIMAQCVCVSVPCYVCSMRTFSVIFFNISFDNKNFIFLIKWFLLSTEYDIK